MAWRSGIIRSVRSPADRHRWWAALPQLLLAGLRMVAVLLTCSCGRAADERVTLYPGYGYREGEQWIIPLRAWVHEPRAVTEAVSTRLAAGMNRLTPAEKANFRARIQHFLADSESREQLTLQFVGDPQQDDIRIASGPDQYPGSDANGLIEGRITLSVDRAQELLRQQRSSRGWLTLQATSAGHTGVGRIQLVEPTGLSVISDIDDTIKITEMLAGRQTVIRNTFFRDFQVVPEMAQRYQQWPDAVFHYVSASPWQLYVPLSEFLFSREAGFPEGTFHMRSVRLNLLTSASRDDLSELLTNANANYDQKLRQISEILQRFPKRTFILVGDSGEKDPEVYRAVREQFPQQIREIWIRDVAGAAQQNAERLQGMRVIPAVQPDTQPATPPQ